MHKKRFKVLIHVPTKVRICSKCQIFDIQLVEIEYSSILYKYLWIVQDLKTV